MNHLDLYDVLAVAARVWNVDALTAIRRTDLDAVDRALAAASVAPGSGFGLGTGGPAYELSERLAAMLEVFVRERPFEGGNRVVSIAVLLQFAGQNGCDLELEPVDELDDLLDRIKDGRSAGTAAFLRGRLRSRPEFSSFGELSFADLGFADLSEESDMFERFSERARRVMVLAQEEARSLDHDYIGTEHVLLAILEEGEGVAAKVLANLNISATTVRATVLEIVGRGRKAPSGHIPFTPRAKRVLEYSLREAMQLGHNYIGTEHILLGIIRDGEGVAVQALVRLGADLQDLRRQVSARLRSEVAVSEFLAGNDEPFIINAPGRWRHLVGDLNSLLAENDHLLEEVRRLREKLTRSGIDPDE